jgi:hypothetical protein
LFHVTPRDELEAALAETVGSKGAVRIFRRPHGDYAQYAVCRRLPA